MDTELEQAKQEIIDSLIGLSHLYAGSGCLVAEAAIPKEGDTWPLGDGREAIVAKAELDGTILHLDLEIPGFTLEFREFDPLDEVVIENQDEVVIENQVVSDIFREFWLCGEAYPLGSFDEDLGIWEHEELINPEDVVIENQVVSRYPGLL